MVYYLLANFVHRHLRKKMISPRHIANLSDIKLESCLFYLGKTKTKKKVGVALVKLPNCT